MNDIEFKDATSTGTVLVDYWAPWCGPCSVMGPLLDRLTAEKGIKLVKINVDENPDLARKANIQGIPAMVLYRDGQQVAEAVGAQTEERLIRKFQL